MAEPVCVVLGVLAFAIQVVQSSKTLPELVVDMGGEPGYTRAIHQEANALYDVALSQNNVLQDEDVQTSICGNKTLIETVE